MKRWSATRLSMSLLLSLGLWVILAILCMAVGSTGLMWPRWHSPRLEMVLMASLIGGALSAAGVVYQAILRNPLADPYLLGISSGASLAAYVWRFTGAAAVTAALLGPLSQQAFAFGGAIVAVAVVFTLSSRRGRMEPLTLLLVGVIVNAVAGAVLILLDHLFPQLVAGSGMGTLGFLVGGIQTNLSSWQEWLAVAAIGVGWLALLFLSGSLNVAMLSAAEAESLGVPIHRLRWAALAVASLITAAAVAVSGPIGFVGLICPHLGRMLVGPDPRKLLPVATALGAGLLAAADAASRMLAQQTLAQTLLPVGVLTGLMGGPFFLLLLWQSRLRRLPQVPLAEGPA